MNILFFAQARDAAGTDRSEWTPGEPVTATELWERLIADHPALLPLKATARIARNGRYLATGELMQQEDEVAILPPVSGG